MNCPTCTYPMRDHGSDLYFCCACALWHHLTGPTTCRVCDTDWRDTNDGCHTCRYWTANLADPNALIIDGTLYFVGPEPTTTDLISFPKLYGCYGTGFVIGRDDGTQITTHNLYVSGAIPTGLRPADNAAFLGEPMPTPEWRHDVRLTRSRIGAVR
jgi:hypothetical protein